MRAANFTGRFDDTPITVIERRSTCATARLIELWRYRELFFFLAWRDVKVRYKQAALGIIWAVLQPLAFMIAFVLFFSRLAGESTAAIPYPLFVLAGLLPWNFVAATVSTASQSIVGNQNLVSKVYFPRLIIPASSAGAPFFDLCLGSCLLIAYLFYYGSLSLWAIVLLPIVVLGLAACAIGIGSFFAALTVSYRDFRYIVPKVVQLAMLLTPAVYLQAESSLPSWLHMLLPWNPLEVLIKSFRACLLGMELSYVELAGALGLSLTLFVAGAGFFRRAERAFADII